MPDLIARADFTGSVDADLMDRFKRILPMMGANVWFIRTALKAFVEEMEARPHPDTTLVIHRAINRMLEETRGG